MQELHVACDVVGPPLQKVSELPGLLRKACDRGDVNISSAGILSIMKAQKAMNGRGGKTLFGYLQPGVKKVFDIVKAVDLNSVFASVEELDEYLDTIQTQMEAGDGGSS